MIQTVWKQGDEQPLSEIFGDIEDDENKVLRIEEHHCGERRVVWENDNTDHWKRHLDYCDE